MYNVLKHTYVPRWTHQHVIPQARVNFCFANICGQLWWGTWIFLYMQSGAQYSVALRGAS